MRRQNQKPRTKIKAWIKEPLIVNLRKIARKKQKKKIPRTVKTCLFFCVLAYGFG